MEGSSADWEQALSAIFDLQLLRLSVLWQLGHDAAASQLVSEACAAARGSAAGWDKLVSDNASLSSNMCQTLSSKLLCRAVEVLQSPSSPGK